QKVHFKFWVQRARYDQPEVAEFANRPFEVVLRDSQGNETLKQQLKADEFGGVAGEHELPAGAPLGPPAGQGWANPQIGTAVRVMYCIIVVKTDGNNAVGLMGPFFQTKSA
ncbi:MAG: hypothetical protein ACKOJF_33350, partial [Planctomycetaceae bacterium]